MGWGGEKTLEKELATPSTFSGESNVATVLVVTEESGDTPPSSATASLTYTLIFSFGGFRLKLSISVKDLELEWDIDIFVVGTPREFLFIYSSRKPTNTKRVPA